jgi:hypothetical protein
VEEKSFQAVSVVLAGILVFIISSINRIAATFGRGKCGPAKGWGSVSGGHLAFEVCLLRIEDRVVFLLSIFFSRHFKQQ